MRRVAGFALIVLLVFAFNACSKKTETKGPYLVKVGNAKITEADLDRELKNLPEFAQALFAGSSGKERFLDELVKKEILYQEAVKKGFDKDPQFKAKVEDFKKITLVGLLLEALGIPNSPVLYDLPIGEKDEAAAQQLLAESGVQWDQPLVAINPVAKWPTKLWAAERFRELAERLFDRHRLVGQTEVVVVAHFRAGGDH